MNASDKISAALPSSLRVDLERSARENERSMSGELRTALNFYLSSKVVGEAGERRASPGGASAAGQ